MNVLQFILLGLIFCSCGSKDSLANINHPNQEQLDEGNQSEKLLSSVTSDHITTSYQYNSDSTLHFIREEWNGNTRSEAEFIYKNGKVSEIIWYDAFDDSEIKRVMEYKGDLLVKQTMLRGTEVLNMEEYFYNENNQMIKQIQKLEWNNESTKQTRVIDIRKVPGKNEIQLTYNGVLSFIMRYDEKANPYSKIKGYSAIYASQFHGITNNILSFKRISKLAEDTEQISDLTFDSSGKYLLESIKKGNDQMLISKEIYTYE